jgi:alkylhydroperoxidase family enzyme
VAFIDYIPGETAPPDVVDAYDRYRSRHGGVDNILRIHGPNPKSMDAHVGLYRTLMFGSSPLSRVQREMLALVVSAVNHCHY